MQHIRRVGLIFGLIICVLAIGLIVKETTQKRRLPMEAEPTAPEFSLTSSVFAEGQPIPAQYTCKGQNTRPPLTINKVPDQAKSLALIMHDPDAVNGEWTHWLVWNLARSAATIDERTLPSGAIEGTTSFGKLGYGGPCPTSGTGDHRYIFELYALDTNLDLPNSADRSQLQKAMQGHIISQTQLMGTFKTD